MAHLTATQLAVLECGHWFAGISLRLRQFLLDAAVLRSIAAGERLFSRGDAPDGLYCVIEGTLKVSGTGESGKEALLVVLEPPNWFGEIALFDGGQRTHDAVAVAPACLLHVPQTALLRLLENEPGHWRELALLLADKLRLAFIALEAMTLLPAPRRLAQRLGMIAEGYGSARGAERSLLRIPQEQLAQMLALSRQSVNQILKEFEAKGILRLHRGGIEIVDLAALRAEA